ncbi:MAG: lysylphosphatidylglycerol synthase domain-containing protein [Spirosomataceae bacterium]
MPIKSLFILVAIFTIIAAFESRLSVNMLLHHWISPFILLTVAVFTGYFANQLIPRAGEVTRCGTLNRLERVPVNVSFGTVVAERVFDVFTLLFLIGLPSVLEFSRLSSFFVELFDENWDSGSDEMIAIEWPRLVWQ